MADGDDHRRAARQIFKVQPRQCCSLGIGNQELFGKLARMQMSSPPLVDHQVQHTFLNGVFETGQSP